MLVLHVVVRHSWTDKPWILGGAVGDIRLIHRAERPRGQRHPLGRLGRMPVDVAPALRQFRLHAYSGTCTRSDLAGPRFSWRVRFKLAFVAATPNLSAAASGPGVCLETTWRVKRHDKSKTERRTQAVGIFPFFSIANETPWRFYRTCGVLALIGTRGRQGTPPGRGVPGAPLRHSRRHPPGGCPWVCPRGVPQRGAPGAAPLGHPPGGCPYRPLYKSKTCPNDWASWG